MHRTLWTHRWLSLLSTGIALALGWFALTYTTAIDITANTRHSLTAESVAAAKAIDEPIEILAVLAPARQTRQAVADLVARYREVNPKISLSFINPETDPARARELQVAPGGELILRTAEREQRLQNVSERALTGALRQLSLSADRRIAFVTGHGERHPSRSTNDDWQVIAERLAISGLPLESLSLASQPDIDPAIDVLVIAASGQAWFPGEVASLKRWLDDGGHLLWLMEPDQAVEKPATEVEQATPPSLSAATGAAGSPDAGSPAAGDTAAKDRERTEAHAQGHAGNAMDSLRPIAEELGIERLPGVTVDAASQAMGLGSPTFVVLNQFPDHPVTRGLASPVLLPEAAAFAVTPLAGQEERVLFQTPAASWTETHQLSGRVEFNDNSGEVRGPLMLGVTIERLIAGVDQRIAIIGDADFGASQFVGNGANQALVERLLLWLSGSEDELSFVSPPPPDAELVLDRRSIIVLSIILLAALPVSCLLMAGVLAWRQRR